MEKTVPVTVIMAAAIADNVARAALAVVPTPGSFTVSNELSIKGIKNAMVTAVTPRIAGTNQRLVRSQSQRLVG